MTTCSTCPTPTFIGCYQAGEPITLSLTGRASGEGLRVALKAGSEAPVPATAESVVAVVTEATDTGEDSDENGWYIEFDTTGLASGDYVFDLRIYDAWTLETLSISEPFRLTIVNAITGAPS